MLLAVKRSSHRDRRVVGVNSRVGVLCAPPILDDLQAAAGAIEHKSIRAQQSGRSGSFRAVGGVVEETQEPTSNSTPPAAATTTA